MDQNKEYLAQELFLHIDTPSLVHITISKLPETEPTFANHPVESKFSLLHASFRN